MVVEADESDGSFLRLDGTIAVVTNIDPEHLEHYGSFDAVKDAFVEFIENVPFYGARRAVRRSSRGAERSSAAIRDRRDRHLRLLGAGRRARRQCRRRCRAATASTSSCCDRDGERRTIEGIALPMPGRHNVQNALAAIGVALELGIDDETIASGFDKFDGVKRRFTKVGEVDGATIIDDYGHHPVEIRAVLSAAREAPRAG